jgi:hypothetical protein
MLHKPTEFLSNCPVYAIDNRNTKLNVVVTYIERDTAGNWVEVREGRGA